MRNAKVWATFFAIVILLFVIQNPTAAGDFLQWMWNGITYLFGDR